jgi:hypothetical protein
VPRIPIAGKSMRKFMLLLAAACASHPQGEAPSDQRMFTMPGEARVAGADCPLKLELGAPLPPLVAGRKATIPIVVRNVSARRVRSCVINGVSARIRSEADGQWRYVVIQGATTDTECSHAIQLRPGETENFAREISIIAPPGPATLDVILGFDRAAFGRECGEALEWQQAVTIIGREPA